MRTMSGGPCQHYDCSNRNSFGYCKTTACINEHYQQEQCGLSPIITKYDELMQSILTAQEEMLKYKIEANSVTLNGRKYGKLIENCPPNMKPTIFGMAVKADYALPDDYDFLVQYEPPQPMTNYDSIRSMSVEELAEFLCHVSFVSDSCYGCVASKECDHGKGFITWLRQECE